MTRLQYYAPLDPECPKVQDYVETLLDDPMTTAYGAPVDDILKSFQVKHRPICTRCQEYGAANIEVQLA